MAKKSKKPKKSGNNKSRKYVKRRTEVYGIFIIMIAILFFISLFGFGGKGILTRYVNDLISYIFGLGKYIFPFVLLIWGISFFIKRIKYLPSRFGWGFLLLFLSLLGLLGVAQDTNNLFDEVVMVTKGGIVGAGIFYGLFRLLSRLGSITILSFLVIISIMIITKISLIDIFKRIKALFASLKPVQYKDNTKPEQEETKKIKPKVNKNAAKSPEIVDYRKKEESYNKEAGRDFYKGEKESKSEQLEMPLVKSYDEDEDYKFPPLSLLRKSKNVHPKLYKQDVKERANILNQLFKDFNLQAKVKRVIRGPSVTLYELSLAPGVKVQRLLSLEDDFCVAMGSPDLRFLTPIPGKSAIGIEVPNQIRSLVTLGDIFAEKADEIYKKMLNVPLGKSLSGDIVTMDIDRMPHILIGGATNSGKSSCINSIIISLLMKIKPSHAKFIMIDPKMVELSIYNDLPHLLTPVVIDPKKAATALAWATEEMDNRFKVLSEKNYKSIGEYNYHARKDKDNDLRPLPYIIVVIDELADLMMVSASDVEDSICRVAQKGRAVGIHLIVATQKPIVKIVTGLIQGNIPARIAFNVAKNVDSRVILDQSGAEKLIGKGDMLYKAPTSSSTLRLQGAFVTSKEIEMITNYIKDVKKPDYSKEISEKINKKKTIDLEEDELLYDALKASADYGHASASLLQRRLKLGYSRAARIIDQLEDKGLISGYDGSKPREILISDDELKKILEKHDKI